VTSLSAAVLISTTAVNALATVTIHYTQTLVVINSFYLLILSVLLNTKVAEQLRKIVNTKVKRTFLLRQIQETHTSQLIYLLKVRSHIRCAARCVAALRVAALRFWN
jgi:uncharacterized protein YcgI (DUF1989 family)